MGLFTRRAKAVDDDADRRVMVLADPPISGGVPAEFLFQVWRQSPLGIPEPGWSTTPEQFSQIARAWLCGFNWSLAPRRKVVA